MKMVESHGARNFKEQNYHLIFEGEKKHLCRFVSGLFLLLFVLVLLLVAMNINDMQS